MIAYYYPPMGGAGAVRPLQFSKFLPEYGWDVTVLTAEPDRQYMQDPSLMSAIPKHQQIVRSRRLPISRLMRRFARGPLRNHLLYSFLDEQFDWVPCSRKKGNEILREADFDAIISSAPPYSSLRIARYLKKKNGIPAVADLRDPFATNELVKWPTRQHQQFYALYERKLLAGFDYILATNDDHVRDLHSVLKSGPPVRLMTNGYDPDDFDGIQLHPPEDHFVIGYIGSIYGRISPRPFFQSLQVALRKRPDIRHNLEVVFVGKMDENTIMQGARRANVDDILRIRGYVPHEDAIKFYHQCHLLIIFSGMVTRSIPAKTFEYAAAHKPVLCFDDPSVFGDFISRNGLGISVNGLNPEEGAAEIIRLYDMYAQGEELPAVSKSEALRYSRRTQARVLASILDFISGNHSQNGI